VNALGHQVQEGEHERRVGVVVPLAEVHRQAHHHGGVVDAAPC